MRQTAAIKTMTRVFIKTSPHGKNKKNLRPSGSVFHALSKTKVSDKRMNQSPRYHFACFPFQGNRSCAIHQSRCRVTEAKPSEVTAGAPDSPHLLAGGYSAGSYSTASHPCRGSLFCRDPGNLSCVIAFPCCFCCLYYSPVRKICQTHFSTNKDHNLTTFSFQFFISAPLCSNEAPEKDPNCSAAGLGFTLEIGKRPGRICPADDALLHGGHIEYTLGKTFPHEFPRVHTHHTFQRRGLPSDKPAPADSNSFSASSAAMR